MTRKRQIVPRATRDVNGAILKHEGSMFEVHRINDRAGVAYVVSDRNAYLCQDGEVRSHGGGLATSRTLKQLLADPTSAYYPTQAAALAAIHAHYHGGDTVTIDPEQPQ
jgi:hypothetical protein